jgi:hypothetical protein
MLSHVIERHFKADLELGYTFLWLAVVMIAQGCLHYLKSLPANSDAPD